MSGRFGVYQHQIKMAAVTGSVKVCETLGCSNNARLQCPTCIKLGIQGSFFCSQVRMCKILRLNISVQFEIGLRTLTGLTCCLRVSAVDL